MGRVLVRGTWVLSLLSLLLAGACGSGETAGPVPTSSSSLNCSQLCKKVQGANCPATGDLQTCVADCSDEIGTLANGCESDVTRYYDCALSHLTCGSDGKAEILPNTCTNELSQVNACTACVVSSTATECTKCEKTACCSQYKTLRADPNRSAYNTCTNNCTDEACRSACDTQYPTIKPKQQAYDDCTNTQCSTQCNATTN